MSWLRNYSIRMRVFLLVSIGLALILAALAFFSIGALQDSTNRVLTERLSTARLVAGDDDVFSLRQEAPHALVSFPAHDNCVPAGDFLEMFQVIRQMPGQFIAETQSSVFPERNDARKYHASTILPSRP